MPTNFPQNYPLLPDDDEYKSRDIVTSLIHHKIRTDPQNDLSKPHRLIIQGKLSNLVRDLSLPKDKVELLEFRLKN